MLTTMGLLDGVRGWRDRRRERQAQEAWGQIAPVIASATDSRWQSFMGIFEEDLQQLLVVKWRLGPGWTAGEGPGRALSVHEVAGQLGLSAEAVRERDWRIVDHARAYWRQLDPTLPRFTMVPIDAAQTWWNRQWSWIYNPDGSRKPQEQWGREEGGIWFRERASNVHELNDDEEERLHLLHDHGRDYVAGDTGGGWGLYHREAHVYDGEDEDWDRQLRGLALPPPPV